MFKIAADILSAKQTVKKAQRQFYLLSQCDIFEIPDGKINIKKQRSGEDIMSYIYLRFSYLFHVTYMKTASDYLCLFLEIFKVFM